MPFVSRKKLDGLVNSSKNLLDELEKISQNSYLISIERKKKINVFTFVRGDKIHKIKTAAQISDDLPAWKRKLLR